MTLQFAFDDAQKAVIALVFIPCALVSLILFKVARRYDDESKRIILYVWITSLLFGEFIFPLRGTNYLQACTMLGFFAMYALQRYAKICTDNPHHTEPEFSTPDVSGMAVENGTQVADFVFVNTGEDVAPILVSTVDRVSEIRKRMRVTKLVLIVMTALCVLEGFYVTNTWVSIALFMVDKALETSIVCIAMIHSMMHCPSERSRNWYWICSAVWCVICVLSTITVLIGNDGSNVTNHVVTAPFYSVCTGCVLFLSAYFVWINQRNSNKFKTTFDVIIFAVGATISWVVSYFL